jgi:PAS domain S-box-containing protein
MQANGQQQPLLGQLPTTIEMALLPSTESRVITEPEEPFRILHVNDVWCHVCGYDAEEVIGETCAVLQGPGTCRATLGMLKQALNFKRNFAVQLLNYTKQGKPFMNTLQVTPLVDSQGRVTHYLGVVIARSLDGTGVPMSVSDPTTNPCKPDALHHRSERPKELTKAAEPSHSLAPQQRHEMPQYPTGGENSGQSRRVQQKLEPQPSAFENGNMSLELLERGDDAGGASTRVPPFLTKLYEILTAESADIVAFNPGVASFTIQNPSVFAKEVLPRYFKHNKLGSFSQQLHTYGFRRRANASSLDASIEFSHDQYTGPPADFMKWVRAGGAISKRSVTSREADAQPPHQLINDMCDLDEGTRQLAMVFQQTRAIQAVQLRTILSKLMLRGLLSPESANYISSLPPGSSESAQQAQQQQSASNAAMMGGGTPGMSYGGGCYGSCGSGLSRASPLTPMGGGSFAMGSRIDSGSFAGENQLLAQLGAAGNSGAYGRISIGSQSFEGLQAQWDALDAGITGIASAVGGKSGFNLGGSNSGSDSGDSMQPFFEMGGPSSGSGSTQGSSTRHGENMHDMTSHACAY